MTNCNIGSVTELQCVLAFTELGYQVSLPFGGQARYDFLVDINGKIFRVQVKTSTYDSSGDYIRFECRNSHYKNGHHVHSTYSNEEIDYFATFYNMKCYIVPVKECSTRKHLRFHSPANNQLKNVNFAEDYEIEKMIAKII